MHTMNYWVTAYQHHLMECMDRAFANKQNARLSEQARKIHARAEEYYSKLLGNWDNNDLRKWVEGRGYKLPISQN